MAIPPAKVTAFTRAEPTKLGQPLCFKRRSSTSGLYVCLTYLPKATKLVSNIHAMAGCSVQKSGPRPSMIFAELLG